jgi:penicillin-binding protein 2
MIPVAPDQDRVAPMTPQLALRVAIVGTCALAMFGIIFFRLWFLQVLSNTQYARAAVGEITRDVPIQPQRGEILGLGGQVLVSSIPKPSVEIAPPSLPTPINIGEMASAADRVPSDDAAMFAALARILGISTRAQRCTIDGAHPPPYGTEATVRISSIACLVEQGVANTEYDNVVVAQQVSPAVDAYLAEQQLHFPGVVEEKSYVRQYALGPDGAQVFGTIGAISCDNPKFVDQCETRQPHFRGVPRTMVVGQSGLEYQYDSWLRGKQGAEQVKVNAQDQFEGYGRELPPVSGENLKTSLDPALERVGQASLEQSMAVNHGTGGAFVAMDPQNGQIYAMGSAPSYNPSELTKPLTQRQYDAMFGQAAGSPLLNRAIGSVGPDGSTFKVITATAALQSGRWSLDQTYDDTGQFCIDGECRHNAGHAAYGVVNMESAIMVSDDVFFYNLGARLNVDTPQGGPLQTWARRYGVGQNPDIDLPGAAYGTVSSPAYVGELNQLETECLDATGQYRSYRRHSQSWRDQNCNIAVNPIEPWTVGDNINAGVGQGDMQISPLQLAIVYSAVANGGTIVTPHVGQDIQTQGGQIVQRIDPGPRRHLNINPAYLQAIRTGLRMAASDPMGTSSDVMGNFPEQVYGKTGTAQYIPPSGPNAGVETDYGWYACFVPATATSKPIVVTVWVEQGGYGDASAAPVARQILSQWFFGRPGPFKGGTSIDA